MKKRNLLLILLALVCVVSMAFGLAACDETPETPDNPQTYTVTYVAGGGSGNAPSGASYQAGATFTVAANTFTHEGHTFTTWSDGEKSVAAGSTYTMPAKNVTFTAQWQENQQSTPQYTVTFDLGEYDGSDDAPAAITKDVNTVIQLPEVGVTWTNHDFLGWLESGVSGEPLAAGDDYTVTKSVTLVAQWEEKQQPTPQYTVTFDLGEYDGSDDAPAAITKDVNTVIQLPEVGVTWTNHDFLGWLESGVSGEPLAAGDDYTVTKSVTLVAQWEEKQQPTPQYTVTFDLGEYDGSDDAPAAITKDVNTVIQLPEVGVTWTNHDFLGWLESGVSGEPLAAGDDYTVTKSVTLVAQWEDNTPVAQPEWVEFTGEVDADPYGYYYLLSPIVWIKLDVNGIDNTLTYKVKGDNTVYTAQAKPEQNEGSKLYYVLSDFATNPVSSPRILVEVSADHETLTIFATDGEKCGDLTVGGGTVEPGPVDPPVSESKSIVFGHGSNAPSGVPNTFPDLESGVVGEEVTIPTIPYNVAHYTFNGWNVYKLVNGDWEQDYDAFPSRIANGGSFTMPNYAIKLVSNFTINYVTVKFDSNGGTGEMPDVTGTYRYNSTLSTTGTKFQNKFTGPNGATFLYWSATTNGPEFANGTKLTEANGVTANDILTLYAIWDTSSVTPPTPETPQDIADFVGKWSTQLESGNHTITVIAHSGDNGIVGYAVLDGKTFITIYLEGDVLLAHNTDDEFITNYTFALSNDTFTLNMLNAQGATEGSHQFTGKAPVPTTSESDFTGKWTRSATQKVLFENDGVAYYTYQGIKTVDWMLVGEYLVFSYTASNDFDYYYILTKSGSSLQGYFLAPDAQQVETTFAANGFYTLSIDGEYVEFVSEGSKPTPVVDPVSPSEQKFVGWVLAGSDTPFSFDEVMTQDASIVAKFVADTTPPVEDDTTVDYRGEISYKINGTTYVMTRLLVDETNLTVTYCATIGGAEISETVSMKVSSYINWAPAGTTSYYIFTIKYNGGNYDHNLAINANLNILILCDNDDSRISETSNWTYVSGSDTFTIYGGDTPGGGEEPEVGDVYVGDLTFQMGIGTKIRITKVVIDEDAQTIVVTYSLNDGEITTSQPLTPAAQTASWAPGGNALSYYYLDGSIRGVSFSVAVYADGTILLCDTNDDAEIDAKNDDVTYISGNAQFTKA